MADIKHHSFKSWRHLLAAIVDSSELKQQLARELSVSEPTPGRWINGTSMPHPNNLRHLLEAETIRPYREKMLDLLLKEYPITRDELLRPHAESVKEIAANTYHEVTMAIATHAPEVRLWTVSTLILDQMHRHLDPDQQGLYLVVTQCVPPGSEKYVTQLQELLTTDHRLTQHATQHFLLGTESLAGMAAQAAAPLIDQFPDALLSHQITTVDAGLKSIAAYPLKREGRIAGSLVIGSVVEQFFTRATTALIEEYVDLLSLAFADRDFFTSALIRLHIAPPFEIQREALRRYLHWSVADSLQDHPLEKNREEKT